METMYDRLGELLNQTLEAGQVRFVSTADLRQEDEPPPPDEGSARAEEAYLRANPHDAQGSTSAHTAAYGDSVHKGSVHTAAHTHDAHGESTHTASQPHSRMSGGAQGEGRRTDTRSTGGRTTQKVGGTRKFDQRSHTKARTQKGGASSARTKASEFKAFTAPRVATMGEEMMRALRLLGLTPSATLEDVKRAYKEKLKYFHPDRYDKNEVLKTVATKKTRMIVEAYELLSKHFAPEEGKPLS